MIAAVLSGTHGLTLLGQSVPILDGFLAESSAAKAGGVLVLHTYPNTGRWFAKPGVTTAYDPKAVELAWARTLAFLKRELP